MVELVSFKYIKSYNPHKNEAKNPPENGPNYSCLLIGIVMIFKYGKRFAPSFFT